MYQMFHAFYSEGKYSIEPCMVVRIVGNPNSFPEGSFVQILAFGQEMSIPYKSDTGMFFNTWGEAYTWLSERARGEAVNLATKVDRLNQMIAKLEQDAQAVTAAEFQEWTSNLSNF